jgi:hypothetical protein
MGQVDKAKQSRKEKLPSKSSQTSWNNNKASFVQYELDDLGKAQCKAWLLLEDNCFDLVHKLCEQGYKFVMKFDGRNQCYATFMSTDVEDHEHANMILVGRGSTPFKATKQALYKHFTCLNETWLEHVGRVGTENIDD